MQKLVPATAEEAYRTNRSKEAMLLAAILAATLAAHARAFSFSFVYDDTQLIVENQLLRSWANVPQFFTMHVWQGLHPLWSGNFYRPLFLVWLLANYSLFGLAPAGWHMATVLLHLLATSLAFLVIRKLTGSVSTAGIAALLFGVHPVHLEATTWISASGDCLYTVPFLAGFLAYLYSRERRHGSWTAVSLICYCLALMSKETAMILPVMIFAHAWIYGAESSQAEPSAMTARLERGFWAAAAYLPFAVAYLCLRIFVLKGFGHESTHLTPATIVLTWPSVLAFYLRLLVFPVGLSEFYPLRYYDQVSLMGVVLPLFVLLLTGAAVWYWQKRSPSREVRFALIWLGVPLLPLLNLSIFPLRDFAHDRYLYLPSIGFLLLVAVAIEQVFHGSAPVSDYSWRPLAVAGVLAILFAFGTWNQSQYWASEYSLYTRALTISPDSSVALNNLGLVYLKGGKEDQAIALFQKAVQADSHNWNASYNLGYLEYLKGNLQDSRKLLLSAVQIDGSDPKQYAVLGLVNLRLGNVGEAVADYQQAIALKPESPGFHFALAVIFAQGGDCRSAVPLLRTELKIDPDNAAANGLLEKCEKVLATP